MTRWDKEHPAQVAVIQKRYRDANRERIREADRLRAQESRAKAPERHRANGLLRLYGLTIEAYEALYARQDGRCAICKRTEAETETRRGIRRLQVDHCHVSGVVRGLLCFRCNTLLGYVHDNRETLLAAVSYLENAEWDIQPKPRKAKPVASR